MTEEFELPKVLDLTSQEVDLESLSNEIGLIENDVDAREIVFKPGVDLRKYAKQIDDDLRQVELESIQDYIKEADNLVVLYGQQDLGAISGEIQTLQAQSVSMGVQLKNRREAEALLSQHIDNLVMSRELIEYLCEREVNDQYAEYVDQLHRKLAFASDLARSTNQTLVEIAPYLDKLRLKVVSRIQQDFVAQLSLFKRPGTNMQVIKDTVLRKRHRLFRFLMVHAQTLGEELIGYYVDLFSMVYEMQFKQYGTLLGKMTFTPSRGLIGDRESSSLFTSSLRNKGSIFALGERRSVLENFDAPPIVIVTAQRQELKFPYEAVFRSMHQLLLESCISEFVFTTELFQQRDVEKAIFAKTLLVFRENLDHYLRDCYDAVGVLLIVRLVAHFQQMLSRYSCDTLVQYFNSLVMTLWERFQVIFDMNLTSVRTLDVRTMANRELGPHYTTRRYAEFALALQTLNQGYGDEYLVSRLASLKLEMNQLLHRFASELETRTKQVIFLINNYEMIVQVFAERQLSSDETKFFNEQLQTQIAVCVEEQLKKYLHGMLLFIRSSEPKLTGAASEEDARSRIDTAACMQVVSDFAGNWKSILEIMYKDVFESFPNWRMGAEVLLQVYAQLGLYYSRYLAIVKTCWQAPPFQQQLPQVQQLMHECKKYGKSMDL
eukprot:TRINITY_DN1891_c0_g1_i6.p1 TRINITY_DN1891_c0_g1~~TRINITY_DN1891_c0_g1_i6.p1  ORF type:complete len:662 (+),score=158.88 TRINITY_DN1891_c0_g1_i6:70-2055(+)